MLIHHSWIDRKEALGYPYNRRVLRLLIGKKEAPLARKEIVMKEAPGASLKNSFDTIDRQKEAPIALERCSCSGKN